MEVILILAGFFLGLGVSHLMFTVRKTTGTLKIDHTNPEKDLYRFEIDNLDDLLKKNRVVLKIDHTADLSQK